MLVGAVGSGTTTAASTVVAQCVRNAAPEALHLYVFDAQGAAVWSAFEASTHCGAVVRLAETERVSRLLARLAEELDRRSSGASCEPVIVVVIDGYAAVRDALGDVGHGEASRRLDRLLHDGPVVGMVTVVTTDGLSSAGLAVAARRRGVFHVGEPGARMRVVESGLEGQIVFDPRRGRARSSLGGPLWARRPTTRRRRPTGARARAAGVVDPDEFDARPPVCVGVLAGASGRVADRARRRRPRAVVAPCAGRRPRVHRRRRPDGTVDGVAPGRSPRGVERHPGGAVIHVDRRRPIEPTSPPRRSARADPLLVVVDDAERVDDPAGALAGWSPAAGRVTFAVAARLEAVRVGVRALDPRGGAQPLRADHDVDRATSTASCSARPCPRRSMIPPRPGLAWMIDHGGHRLVQVAARMPPMTRIVTVAGAQLGPVQLADDRADVVERMIVLLQEAASQGSDLVVFPELALTTFFPRWFVDDITTTDHFYERSMPNEATQPLFDEAKHLEIGFSLGYALLEDGARRHAAPLERADARRARRARSSPPSRRCTFPVTPATNRTARSSTPSGTTSSPRPTGSGCGMRSVGASG